MKLNSKQMIIGGGFLCLFSAVYIIFYIYYTIIIKERPFPESGTLSLSGCYVTDMYFISNKDSYLMNIIYYYPAFIKVFDAKTKKCIYTSNIYDAAYLSPLFIFEDETVYGFFSIDTKCKKHFIAPKEFTPDF